MDFSRLPEPVFLKIVEYLPLEDRVRVRRVDKTFRQIGQLAISHIKSLDLTGNRFRNLTPEQLTVILDLCWSKLERIKFPSCLSIKKDWEQRRTAFDKHVEQLEIILANYRCPRLTDIDLGCTQIDYAVFEQLIRNNPNMENFCFRHDFDGFPEMTNSNLKKLTVIVTNEAALRSMIGQFPNLNDLNLKMENFDIDADILDQFFRSVSQVHQIRLTISFFEVRNHNLLENGVAGFWNLPLTSLEISFPCNEYPGDSILCKVATSFPNLQTLDLHQMAPTNAGVASLAVLQELEVLDLSVEDGDHYDQGIRKLAGCKKLKKLSLHPMTINGGTLVNLLRRCHQLELVDIWNIGEVDDPEELAVVLESLVGIRKREITIQQGYYSDDEEPIKLIWEVESVKELIGKLEENDGPKIKIIWTEM